MKYWWITNPPRLEQERDAVEVLTERVSWFNISGWEVSNGRLSLVGNIVAHEQSYAVRLLYPDRFPLVPAWVVPQDPEARWSYHQYGAGGTLCLELRPDNWDPNATGADVLQSAFNLLDIENPLGDEVGITAPSAHVVNNVQSYDWTSHPVLISGPCFERLKNGVFDDVTAIRWTVEDNILPILISDTLDKSQLEHPAPFDLGTMRFAVKVFASRTPAPNDFVGTRQEFADAVGVNIDGTKATDSVVFLAGSDDIMVHHSPNDGSVFLRKWIVLHDVFGERSGHGSTLSTKTVGIIGVGSVGSKIAETLLRSGIRSFVLADGDVFLPANLERHVLDWRDVGARKVQAMKRRLLQIFNGTDVLVIDENFDWQVSSSFQALKVDCLSNCDLVIDASGDEATSRFLGALAHYNRTPFLSAKVYGGGSGCVIARSIPDTDASYSEGYSAYKAFCDEQDRVPPSIGQRAYEVISDAGEPMVADDAAISMASAHASRVAIDILNPDAEVGPSAWLLIGFRKEWIFDAHGHIWYLYVGGPIEPVSYIKPSARMTEFYDVLFKGVLDEINTPS